MSTEASSTTVEKEEYYDEIEKGIQSVLNGYEKKYGGVSGFAKWYENFPGVMMTECDRSLIQIVLCKHAIKIQSAKIDTVEKEEHCDEIKENEASDLSEVLGDTIREDSESKASSTTDDEKNVFQGSNESELFSTVSEGIQLVLDKYEEKNGGVNGFAKWYENLPGVTMTECERILIQIALCKHAIKVRDNPTLLKK